MSRTVKVSVFLLYHEGRKVKTHQMTHGGECFLCDKGKRPKRVLSKARRRKHKKQLELEKKEHLCKGS